MPRRKRRSEAVREVAGHYPTDAERDERHKLDVPFEDAARRLVVPLPAAPDDQPDEREAGK